MSFRFRLSRLAEGRIRRAATRWLFGLSLAGFVSTLLFLAATGRGLDRWFFALVVWLGLIALPLWLGLQAFQSLGSALRRDLRTRAAARPDRYRTSTGSTLVVEELFEQHVLMPRIATPEQAQQARAAAAALVQRTSPVAASAVARSGDGTMKSALARCLGAVDEWTQELSTAAQGDTAGNIQGRWDEVRALAGLAGVAKTLLAVWQDQGGGGLPVPGDRAGADAFLEAVFDYCDELALRVEAATWAEPPLGLPPQEGVRETWRRFAQTPPPAPAALEAFVKAALSPQGAPPL